MEREQSLESRRREYERLKARLLDLGPVVQGSILARTIERADPRSPRKRGRYGPYYQWTRKIHGRTVNVNLTPAQAKAFGRAIAQNRRLESTLERMREVSLQLLEGSTVGVKKRKPRIPSV